MGLLLAGAHWDVHHCWRSKWTTTSKTWVDSVLGALILFILENLRFYRVKPHLQYYSTWQCYLHGDKGMLMKLFSEMSQGFQALHNKEVFLPSPFRGLFYVSMPILPLSKRPVPIWELFEIVFNTSSVISARLWNCSVTGLGIILLHAPHL